MLHRRFWLKGMLGSLVTGVLTRSTAWSAQPPGKASPLKITNVRITPIALPDPPLLAAGGCHGPYFLRNIVQVETDAGVTGIAETRGGQRVADELEKARPLVVGHNAFAYRGLVAPLAKFNPGVYAGIELACLDACG